jgi:hypothetical protein
MDKTRILTNKEGGFESQKRETRTTTSFLDGGPDAALLVRLVTWVVGLPFVELQFVVLFFSKKAPCSAVSSE